MDQKNKTIVLILLFLFSACVATNAQDSNLTKEWREISGFHAVHIKGPFQVYIIQDDKYEITIEGENCQIRNLKTSVCNSILTIAKFDVRRPESQNKVKIYIRMPKVDDIRLYGDGLIKAIGLNACHLNVQIYGSGIVDLDGVLAALFEVEVSGSGKIELDVNAESIKAGIRGSGTIVLTGNCTSSELSVSGSGVLNAQSLFQNECLAKIYGSGQVIAQAKHVIDSEILGSGKLFYTGDPEIRMNSVGGGKITRIN